MNIVLRYMINLTITNVNEAICYLLIGILVLQQHECDEKIQNECCSNRQDINIKGNAESIYNLLICHHIQKLAEFLTNLFVMGAFLKALLLKQANTGGVFTAYRGDQHMFTF